MTPLASTKTLRFAGVRAALVEGTPFTRCSTCHTGLGMQPLGNAIGSRDAP